MTYQASILSWAGIVDAYSFELDDWKHLDLCIGIFEDLRKTHPSFPSKEIDLIASSRMFIALTLRNMDQPERVEGWLERLLPLPRENPPFDTQIDTIFSMTLYYLWKGAYNKNAVLLERAGADILHHKASPFVVIRVKLMQGIHYWITAQYDAALSTLSEGLYIAQQNGVHVFDSMLWSFRAAAEMAPGNLESAGRSLNNQMASLLTMNKTLDVFFYHINAAWYAILKGNPSLAAEHMETIAARVEEMSTPYYRALWNIGMAQVAFLQGRKKEAAAYVHTAHQLGLGMKSQVMEWYALLVGACFLLRKERKKKGSNPFAVALF